MELFYTTSSGYDEQQIKPSKSLGGYKSSTNVVNDDFGNLFDEITPYSINLNKPEHIALIQKNNDSVSYTNVEIWIVAPTNAYSTLKLGVEVLKTDAEGNGKTQLIRDKYNRPYNVDFQVHDENNKLAIGPASAGDEVGIWIRRELNIDFIKSDQTQVFEIDPTNPNMYVKKSLEGEDVYTLFIEYT